MWAFLEGRPADDSFRRLTACHVKVPSFISTAALCWMILPTVRVLVPMKESITCRTYFVDCVYSVAFRVQVVCMTECCVFVVFFVVSICFAWLCRRVSRLASRLVQVCVSTPNPTSIVSKAFYTWDWAINWHKRWSPFYWHRNCRSLFFTHCSTVRRVASYAVW